MVCCWADLAVSDNVRNKVADKPLGTCRNVAVRSSHSFLPFTAPPGTVKECDFYLVSRQPLVSISFETTSLHLFAETSCLQRKLVSPNLFCRPAAAASRQRSASCRPRVVHSAAANLLASLISSSKKTSAALIPRTSTPSARTDKTDHALRANLLCPQFCGLLLTRETHAWHASPAIQALPFDPGSKNASSVSSVLSSSPASLLQHAGVGHHPNTVNGPRLPCRAHGVHMEQRRRPGASPRKNTARSL